jgi:phage major head subunit gpT-like protein
MKLFEGFKKDFGTSHDRSQYYDMVLVMKNVKASRYYVAEESEVRIY